jgi:transaldolase
MDLTKLKIFYDGDNIQKYHNIPSVVGFTMNSTFIKQSGFSSWRAFYEANKELIRGRPISFQVTNDTDIENQALLLHSFDTNIYVKVPVENSRGESNMTVINALLQKGVKINITCVYTARQIHNIFSSLTDTPTPCIVSIFAGGISDAGLDPVDTVKLAVQQASPFKAVEILWAGVKDNLAFRKCIETGCHILTVPDTVMDRMNRIGLDLEEMARNKVILFNTDARSITIE